MTPWPAMMIGRFGLVDEFGGAANHAGVAFGRGLVAAEVDLLRPIELGLFLEDVLRDVDEHRAGAAGAADVGGLADA